MDEMRCSFFFKFYEGDQQEKSIGKRVVMAEFILRFIECVVLSHALRKKKYLDIEYGCHGYRLPTTSYFLFFLGLCR